MYNYSTYTGLVFYLALTKMTVLRQIKRTLWTLLSMMLSVRGMQSKRRKRENWCWWLQAGRGEAEVSGPAPRSLVRAPQGWTDSDAAQWCTGESVPYMAVRQCHCPVVYRWVCPMYDCDRQWCCPVVYRWMCPFFYSCIKVGELVTMLCGVHMRVCSMCSFIKAEETVKLCIPVNMLDPICIRYRSA